MDQQLDEVDLTASTLNSSHDEDAAAHSTWKQRMLSCLNGVVASGDFAVSRHHQTFPSPGLRIVGSDVVIALPLTECDAETIRGACSEAPSGDHDEMLVDTAMGKTWELDATRFECTNPSWQAFFNTLLGDVAAGLGLPDVSAKLHNLVLSDKGSLSKLHKDPEEDLGMVATLVVCLPCKHTGGDVHLSFRSERREYTTAPTSPFDITALACVKHSAQYFFEQTRQLKSILGEWQADPEPVSIVAYPLAHNYTNCRLSMNALKDCDRAVCNVLQTITATSRLYLVLAHMTHTTAGFDFEFHFGTRYDTSRTTLDTIYSCDGRRIGSEHRIHADELLDPNMFADREADSQDEDSTDEGSAKSTDDEGAPTSLRYHDTVAVLIAKHRIHEFFRTAGYRAYDNREAENLLSMVKQDYAEHGNRPDIKSVTWYTMKKILDASAHSSLRTVVYAIAKWALEAKEEDLYHLAMQNSNLRYESLTELVDVASQYLDENFANDPKGIDWKQWVGPFLDPVGMGTSDRICKVFMARIKTKALRDSFRDWARPQMDLQLDSQKLFTVEDHDFFLANLMAPSTGDKIASAFFSRSTRELILKVLDSIFGIRQQFSDDAVKGLFEKTLKANRSRLALEAEVLFEERSAGHTCYIQVPDESRVSFRQFTTLIKQTLTVGASQQASELVEDCHRAFNDGKSSWETSRTHNEKLANDLLVPLASGFHSCQVSPTPGVTAFFHLAIRHALHSQVPRYPKKLNGWRHKSRGCGRCADCAAMDVYLESEVQRRWGFRAGESRRAHIQSRLPRSIFEMQTIWGSPATLQVEKRGTEYQEDVKDFPVKLREAQSLLAPLRGAVFQSILGDAAYRELIELGHLRRKRPAAVGV
ncbi:hypothetical protein V8C44DRAFT_366102 [Trichoderma aethiopicum]